MFVGSVLALIQLAPDQVFHVYDRSRYWAGIVRNWNSFEYPELHPPTLRYPDRSLKDPPPAEPYVVMDVYSILQVWLADRHADVYRQTVPFSGSIAACFPHVGDTELSAALTDFAEQNSVSWRFLPLSGESVRLMHTQMGSPPRPTVSISAFGFNKPKTLAVFRAWDDCGPLCGDDSFYVSRKHHGTWDKPRSILQLSSDMLIGSPFTAASR